MRSTESRSRILLLHAAYTDRLSYYDDWHDAFLKASFFSVTSVNIARADAAELIRGCQNEVDGLVLLHSTNGDTTVYLEPCIPVLADRKRPLLSFVGNEVNLPGSSIAGKRSAFARFCPDVIATQLLPEAGAYLFGDIARHGVVSIPHALNPEAFRPERPSEDRPIDVGARAARYLPHLGDDDRNRLLDYFRDHGAEYGLRTDISNSRVDRSGWAAFLNACKGTVATEAGSWFIERDDAIVNRIREQVLREAGGLVIPNDSGLRKFGHKLPWWARQIARKMLSGRAIRHESVLNERLDADRILAEHFAGKPYAPVYGKCISSRHFDAIGTKTCQIMFPGRFNDMLVADEHYIALQPDFSNLNDVMERFRDPVVRGAIVQAAYDLAVARHTYAHRTQQVFEALSAASARY